MKELFELIIATKDKIETEVKKPKKVINKGKDK